MTEPTLVAGFGDGIDFIGSQRYLAADAGGWFVWIGNRGPKMETPRRGPTGLRRRRVGPRRAQPWQHLAATFDGTTLSFYVNGKLAAGEKSPSRKRPCNR